MVHYTNACLELVRPGFYSTVVLQIFLAVSKTVTPKKNVSVGRAFATGTERCCLVLFMVHFGDSCSEERETAR